MAHKLKIDAVHKSMSNDIHMSHSIQPTFHDPEIDMKKINKYIRRI